ncbi:GAIN domain N-terminal [Trinorchestia longiramus]|nr:GAIN domain N-terminal [Trinorchestia longiramus]
MATGTSGLDRLSLLPRLVNLPHGRPRPSWLMEAQSTVSSITGDQPLQRPPHARDRANSPTESGGLGVSKVDTLGGLPDGDAGDGILDSELLDPDGLGSSSSTSTTTTLRPPPWLKTNLTKNLTTTTTTTSTTSTTTTTTPPRPSTPNNSDSSSPSSMAPPLDDESNLPSRGRVDGAPATIPVSFPDSQAANSESDHTLGEEDMRGRQDIFEDQDILLEEEMGHSFSHNYPQVPVGQDHANENLPSPGWRPRESWCGPSSGRGLMWNWTRAGEKAVQACPGGASGWARRDCYMGGWAPRADLGECRSVWLSTLTSRAQGSDSVLAVVHDLSAVTAVRSLYGGDVTAAARLLTSLAKRMAMSLSHFPDTAQREALLTELLSTTLASASHLIGSQEDAWGDLQPNEHRAAVTTLLLGLEQAAFLLADNLRHQKVVVESYPNILMRLQVLETRNVANPVTFPSLDEVWQVPTPQPGPPSSSSFSAIPLEPAASSIILNRSSSSLRDGSPPIVGNRARGIPAYDSITLPPEALLENSENRLIKMVFFSYQGLEKLLQPTFSYSLDPAFKMQNRTRLLNSRVVAASLGSGRHIELTEPVIITFALLTTQNVTNASCVFWDYTTSIECCPNIYHEIVQYELRPPDFISWTYRTYTRRSILTLPGAAPQRHRTHSARYLRYHLVASGSALTLHMPTLSSGL